MKFKKLLLAVLLGVAALSACQAMNPVRNTWKSTSNLPKDLTTPLFVKFELPETMLAGRLISLDEETAELQTCTVGIGKFAPRMSAEDNMKRRRLEAAGHSKSWDPSGPVYKCTLSENIVTVDLATVQKVWISEVSVPNTLFFVGLGGAILYMTASAIVMLIIIIGLLMMSCPLIYVLNADGNWELLGEAFAGAISKAMSRTDLLAVPLPQGDEVELLVANESREIEYIDLAQLVVVDTPASTRAVATHTSDLVLIGEEILPSSAADINGPSPIERLSASDERAWFTDLAAVADADEGARREWLVVDFPAMPGESALLLDLRNTWWSNQVAGEIYRAHGARLERNMERASNPDKAQELLDFRKESGFDLRVEVEIGGEWQEVATVPSVGPAAFREMVVPLPESDQQQRVRLSGGVGFWEVDRMALVALKGTPVTRRIAPLAAERAGDSELAALASIDGEHAVMERDESIHLRFALPEAVPGQDRSLFFETHGYYQPLAEESTRIRPLLLTRLWLDPTVAGQISVELYREFLSAAQFQLAAYRK
jgi:hypothetical protein